jgi:hypothetical protein
MIGYSATRRGPNEAAVTESARVHLSRPTALPVADAAVRAKSSAMRTVIEIEALTASVFVTCKFFDRDSGSPRQTKGVSEERHTPALHP